MSTDDGIRASDGDRENAVAILRDAYVAGRLTLPEFDERTSAAFASRTWGDLRKLTGDLPVKPALGDGVPPAPVRQPPGARRPGPLARPDAARLIPALPIVLVWLAISLSAHGAGAYLPLLVLLVIGLRMAGGHHYQRRGRPGQQPPRQGPGRPSDPAD